jgi:hypothetical protein
VSGATAAILTTSELIAHLSCLTGSFLIRHPPCAEVAACSMAT